MTDQQHHPALRRRLLALSGAILVSLALLTLVLMHGYARRTADSSYDLMLGSAVLQLGQSVRRTSQGFTVDLPVAAFATLAQARDDRVFYRISVNGDVLTGYPDLPAPPPRSLSKQPLTQARPDFFNVIYQGEPIRVARLFRLNTERLPPDEIVIELAQTRQARNAMADDMLHPALELMLVVLTVALGLLWLGIYYAFSPFRQLARALEQRSPKELTPLALPVPKETLPLLDTINHFIARQQALLERVESYTSVAAHQLRTPLATLRALCENARDETDDARRQRLLAQLVEQCDQLSLTVRHLLNQAMLDHRFHSLEPKPVALNELTRRVCMELAVQALHRRVELAFEAAPAEVHIKGDAFALTQMLNNLIENAVAHSPEHGLVEIGVAMDGRIYIRDQGPGIAGDEKEKVFERFYRGTASRHHGSGMGMAIARDVAEHHHAYIYLADNVPHGLVVEIRFNAEALL
ncbi:sensor histidine kinase N-terminal domain-containing protein [Oceanimonas baumannii]|uniref:sensor histidine kinase n=1 Tax=Oceanimonas baumannii TaxID=129578 RepID=UPI001D18C752|nr:sensor histidine kinase [Oceanimonas baumannii]MCC4263997.1 sensor histidine kinase N-terminal domain-containing protein [Oceanimonas baumannii]